jgi:hypothetical protein
VCAQPLLCMCVDRKRKWAQPLHRKAASSITHALHKTGQAGKARRGWSQSGISGMQLPVGPDPCPHEGRWQPCRLRSLLSATGPWRPDDSGTAKSGWDVLPRKPIPYADNASSSSAARGWSAVTANRSESAPGLCAHALRAFRSNLSPQSGAEREVYEATQDHPLCR